MVLTYFLNDFEMVPVAPIITGITLVFTFHVRCISVVRSLYLLSLLLLLCYIGCTWLMFTELSRDVSRWDLGSVLGQKAGYNIEQFQMFVDL
jgi:hypothetical protein